MIFPAFRFICSEMLSASRVVDMYIYIYICWYMYLYMRVVGKPFRKGGGVMGLHYDLITIYETHGIICGTLILFCSQQLHPCNMYLRASYLQTTQYSLHLRSSQMRLTAMRAISFLFAFEISTTGTYIPPTLNQT